MFKYHVIVPVWGDHYIDLFLGICLPSQLSPGNLPNIEGLNRIKYRVYTRPGDGDRIRSSPVTAKLKRLVDTVVIEAAGVRFDAVHHYQPFSACYRLGMREAESDRAGCVFLTADQVWADGSMAHIIRMGDRGVRAVLVSGPRVASETFIPYFITDFPLGEDSCVTLEPRKAVNLALEYLHPWDRSLFWDHENRGRPASFMFWSAGKDGFIMRCFHLHPVLVNPKGRFPRFRYTIDGSDFVRKASPQPDAVHVVQDSDDVMYFSIAPSIQSAELIDSPKTDWHGLLRWGKVNMLSKHNLHYLQKPIRFHVGAMSGRWDDVEKLSSMVVDPVGKALDSAIKLCFYRSVTQLHSRLVPLLMRSPVFQKPYKSIAGFVKRQILG